MVPEAGVLLAKAAVRPAATGAATGQSAGQLAVVSPVSQVPLPQTTPAGGVTTARRLFNLALVVKPTKPVPVVNP